MWLVFSIDQRLLRKLVFAKTEFYEETTIFVQKNNILRFGDMFTFSNACAIQINLGANEPLKPMNENNCAGEYGQLAKGIRN